MRRADPSQHGTTHDAREPEVNWIRQPLPGDGTVMTSPGNPRTAAYRHIGYPKVESSSSIVSTSTEDSSSSSGAAAPS